MPEYIDYPIQSDPEALLQEFIEDVRVYFPNFSPAEGDLSYRAAASLIRMIAESREVASQIPRAIFRYYGPLVNCPPLDGLFASTTLTITVRDDTGYDPLPAGTLFSIQGQFFELVEPLLIPSGSTVFTDVVILATDKGTERNGLGTDGIAILEEPYEYVIGVTADDPTSGGEDEETADEYESRLRTVLTLLSPRAITTDNLSTLASTIPGVARAVAIKGLNADTGTTDNEGMATVAVLTELGAMVPQFVKDQVEAAIVGPDTRLVNNVIFVIDPAFTAVGVRWNATQFPGADDDEVEAQVNLALTDLFNPALWGQPLEGDRRLWYNKTIISEYDIAAAIDRAQGVDRVTYIAISLDGDTHETNDRTLDGYAPVATPGPFVRFTP